MFNTKIKKGDQRTSTNGGNVILNEGANPVGNGSVPFPPHQIETFTQDIYNTTEAQAFLQGNEIFRAGDNLQLLVRNVGLATKQYIKASGTITISSSITADTLNLHPEFPYNLFSQIQVQFNGNTNLVSAKPSTLLANFISSNRAQGLPNRLGDGVVTPTYVETTGVTDTSINGILPTSLCNVTIASSTASAGRGVPNGTLVKSYTNLRNILTSNATNSIVLNVEFLIPMQYYLSKLNTSGMLPIQNNSINMTVNMKANNLVGTTFLSSVFQTTTPANWTIDTNINLQLLQMHQILTPSTSTEVARYLTTNQKLIQENSYSINTTGQKAVQINLTNNNFITKLQLLLFDSTTGEALNIAEYFNSIYLDYSGSSEVYNIGITDLKAIQATENGTISTLPHQLIQYWNDDRIEQDYLSTGKWIDNFTSNNPRIVGDVIKLPAGGKMTILYAQEFVVPVDALPLQ